MIILGVKIPNARVGRKEQGHLP